MAHHEPNIMFHKEDGHVENKDELSGETSIAATTWKPKTYDHIPYVIAVAILIGVGLMIGLLFYCMWRERKKKLLKEKGKVHGKLKSPKASETTDSVEEKGEPSESQHVSLHAGLWATNTVLSPAAMKRQYPMDGSGVQKSLFRKSSKTPPKLFPTLDTTKSPMPNVGQQKKTSKSISHDSKKGDVSPKATVRTVRAARSPMPMKLLIMKTAILSADEIQQNQSKTVKVADQPPPSVSLSPTVSSQDRHAIH